MRYAVVGDVHSNLEALVAVLGAARGEGVDAFLFLGDLVGYNADPDACVETLFSLPVTASVRGNHDKAVCGLMDLEWFNQWARQAVEWTRESSSAGNATRLAGLPQGPRAVGDGILLCHGAPMDEDLYIQKGPDARAALRFLESEYPRVQVCFFGHTHVATVVDGAGRMDRDRGEQFLEKGRRYLINPGSVGQPRDGNPRASFGIFDSGKRTYRNLRIAYDVAAVQRKVLAAGLPVRLAQRLALGA